MAALLAAPGHAGAAERPLATAIQDFDYTATHFDRVRAAGARTVKLVFPWRRIAPDARPADFDPANPDDPRYDWSPYDDQVREAVARGLEPLITTEQAPLWAERGTDGPVATRDPDPAEFGAFGTAIARRYSGTVAGLPRVRLFEAWNEPNASFFLSPAFVNGQPYSPQLYRAMVNSFSAGVHGVHADNVVIAGAQFPFVINRPSAVSIGPYRFMRDVLCLSEQLKTVPNCGPPLAADVWSHHPYTSGGPTHRASNRDAISLGDMLKMKRALNAAIKQKRFASSQPIRFWVTEFGWDSAPSDPKGVPLAAARALGVGGALPDVVLGRQPRDLVPAARRAPGRAGPVRPVVPMHRRDRLRRAEALVAEGVPVPVRGVPLRQAARARLGPDPGQRPRQGRDRALAEGQVAQADHAARRRERRVPQAHPGPAHGQHPRAPRRAPARSRSGSR